MAENSSMQSKDPNKLRANQAKRPKVLGVTGTIASGKSLVGKLLAARGIPVVDTDVVVHEILAGDEVTKKAILDEFGKAVFLDKPAESGATDQSMPGLPAVDRKKLGAVVFSDESKRRKLEAIVHPNVVLACRRKVKEHGEQGQKLVAILVPLLFEANLAGEYDEIWSVFTKEAVLKERLRERDNLEWEEIEKRLAAQMPQEEKARRANQVIDNSGSAAETERQVNLLLDKVI